LNGDGLLDLVVVNHKDRAQVWRNVGGGTAQAPLAMGHWVELRLAQAAGNRDAIGAWIELRSGEHVQRREVTSGGGHASGQLGWLHFGLGEATAAEVRITWPGGLADDWQPLAGDARYVLSPGHPAVAWRRP